jgi:CsoR family transcriptional regulator, copper-sensing transcriptional repressor
MAVHEHTQQVARRLSRIEGHVRAVKEMVQQERPCADVLIQIAAVRAALDKAAGLLLLDHVEHCIAPALQRGETEDSLADLQKALKMFIN